MATATQVSLLTPTAAEPILIRLPISHYCHKVEWALAHAEQPYAKCDVWFRTLVSFTDINPENTVPVLVVDGHRIAGSQAILQWLDERHPGLGLYSEPAVTEWEAWADATIGPYARRIAYRTIYAHPTHYTGNPALWPVLRAGKGLVLNILKHAKARRFEEQDERAGPEIFDRISAQLGETGTGYLFGATPTAADFATAALLSPVLRIRKEAICDHPAWSEMQAYVKRLRHKPAVRGKHKWTPTKRSQWAALPLRA